MPKYRVTSPDGRTFEINAPDGATEDQVMAFARQQFSARQSEPAPNPTDGMSGLEKFAAGYGSAAPRLVRGIGQRLGLISQQEVDEANRLDAPLLNTGAGVVGNVLGNVGIAAPTVAIPGAASIPGAAVIGGVQGLATPTSTGESAGQNAAIGAALGPAAIMAGRGVLAAAQGAKAFAQPFTEAGRQTIAGRTIQRFAEDPARLANAAGGSTVTGAFPTLAESTLDPGIARLQDAVRSLDPQIANRIDARLAQNNAARINVLRDIAGDDSTRAAANQARSAATSDLYQTATNANYTVDQQLQNLLNTPVGKQALKRAETIALNNQRPFQFTVDAPSDPFSGVGGSGMREKATRQVTGQGLQDLKMAFDELLTDPTSGFAGKSGDAVRNVRNQLVGWMESANPDFKAARMAYAEASKPLNQQDIGTAILKRGTSATSDLGGEPRLMANSLLRALQDEKGLIEQATGRKGIGNRLSDVMTPQQEALIRAVANEADTVAAVGRAANGPGSATAQRMAAQNILRQMVGPTGLPESWAESAIANTLIGKPFNLLYGGVAEPKIQQALAEAVLNPSAARNALAAAGVPGRQAADAPLVNLLRQAARVTPGSISMSRER